MIDSTSREIPLVETDVVSQEKVGSNGAVPPGFERPTLLDLEKLARYLANNPVTQKSILGTTILDEEGLINWMGENPELLDGVSERVAAAMDAGIGNLDLETPPAQIIDVKVKKL